MAVDMLLAGGENKMTRRLVRRYRCGRRREQDDRENISTGRIDEMSLLKMNKKGGRKL
jgi:hypothetical protein